MDLHQQFVQLGRSKQKIQYRLLALLPKILKSGIYLKYARTIEGYAWRFVQIPESVVKKALNFKLEGLPHLQAAVATVGVHKVAMLAKVATPENEEMLVDKLKNMSKEAVQVLSKEMRGHKTEKITIELEGELMRKFLELKKKYGTNKAVMKKLLAEKSSRKKCAYPDCHKPSEQDHHPEKQFLVKGTKKTVPLCKAHHEFMHNGLVENQTDDPEKWRFTLTGMLDQADLLYRKYWLEAQAVI